MKRHESLIPLSRDHHTALLCCWKIREAIKKGVTPERISLYVDYFFNQHLLAHFHEEETLVFCHNEGELINKARTDHQELIALATRIKKDRSNEMLLQFADLLDNHIRFEERILFPYLESLLPKEKLKQITKQISQIHNKENKDNYVDNFWI